MLIKGSVGMIFVMLSAMSGTSENVITAAAVDATDVRIEEVRAYRRREVRSRKNVFQSRVLEFELVGGEVVDALRVRHKDGVKKDEEVSVEGEGFAATEARVDDGSRCRVCGMRAAVEMLHRDLGEAVFEMLKSGRV